MEKSGGSKLLQMQARFQQKQLQERELKIASLYEAQQARALDRVRHSPSNGVSTAPSTTSPPPKQPLHPGKVRQMFEERRTKGIDKSYPLQPIHNTERPAARKALPNGFSKVTTSRVSIERKKTTAVSVKKQLKAENLVNGSGDLNHNHESDMNSTRYDNNMPPQSNGEVMSSIDELDKADNNYLLENETFPDALAPTPTPRSPEPKNEPKRPPRKSPATRSSPVSTKPQPVAPPRRVNSDTVSDGTKSREAMQRASNPVLKKPTSTPQSGRQRSSGPTAASKRASAGAAASDGAACGVCGRRFAPDRLAKHQEICKKASTKKRKPFDVLKHRLAGTEAEPFINKLRKQNNTSTKQSTKESTTKANKSLNSNWRQKHEEFINAIRAAKQVQAHINAGGKLSDLPPPPPSENPDYVQCPHCSRRFNQGAAERHIPKCSNYQFNKPKPGAKRR